MNHSSTHAACAPLFLGRRRLLQAGTLGWMGLNQANFLQADSGGAAKPIRSCIFLFYYGGPSHLDTWDMKPNAPAEVRGEFRPIATTVPGIQVCEHMPRSARVVDKLAIVRSMHHPMRNHNAAAVEALCGRTPLKGDLELLNDDANSFPCYGASLDYLKPARRLVPTQVALPHVMYNVVRLPGQTAGFLGAPHNPFQITSDPSRPDFHIDELVLPGDLSPARMADRRSLLALVDSQQRHAERRASMSAHQERAFNLISSEEVRRAFDLSRESTRVRDRYGWDTLGQSLLLARRLVEGGVRFINVNDKINNGQVANWDSHENNFGRLKNDLLPPSDQAFSALIEDLETRGLLETTLVVALAEFGRTPKINGNRGRDHWPDCFTAILAGGGVRGGAVYGASDRIGAYPAADPVTSGDLAATLFWRFGLDPKTEIKDRAGQAYRLANGDPLFQLFG
ncbi:MAG: DUF1501 domain-containing protein [Gemmataceae bacterium]|nr:DUF1501 domain-containing protein [Gemmataceae bacterium]